MDNLISKTLSSVCMVAAIALMTPAAAMGDDEIRYIANDQVRLGVDAGSGGSICYFSLADAERNVLNRHDRGRFVQQSYYGDADGSLWNGKPWRWNPVQGGDWRGKPAEVLESQFRAASLFVRSRPRHWASGESLDETEMQMRIELDGLLAHVEYRFAYLGEHQHGRRSQELPAVFADYALKNLVFYQGDSPWRDKPLTRVVPGWPNEAQAMDESWAAYVDDDNWGVGVFTDRMTKVTSYRHAGDEKTGPKASACSYFAPVEQMAIGPGFRLKYDVYLTIGPLDDIRSRFTELHEDRVLRENE